MTGSSNAQGQSGRIYSRIIGTGRYLPEKVVTNADLEMMVETSDEWIRDRTGIRQRHVAATGETTGDLALYAATHAQIGSAPCRERVCQYRSLSGVAA